MRTSSQQGCPSRKSLLMWKELLAKVVPVNKCVSVTCRILRMTLPMTLYNILPVWVYSDHVMSCYLTKGRLSVGDWSNLERHVRLVEVRDTHWAPEDPLNDCRWPALRSQARALFSTRWELQTFCHRTNTYQIPTQAWTCKSSDAQPAW